MAYPAAWKKVYQRQLADLGIGRLGFVTNFFIKLCILLLARWYTNVVVFSLNTRRQQCLYVLALYRSFMALPADDQRGDLARPL